MFFKCLYSWHKYLLKHHSNLITFKKCHEFHRLHSTGLVTRGLPSVTCVPHLLERRNKEPPVQAWSQRQQVHGTQDPSVQCKLEWQTRLVSHRPPNSYQINFSKIDREVEGLSLIIHRCRFCSTDRNKKNTVSKEITRSVKLLILSCCVKFLKLVDSYEWFLPVQHWSVLEKHWRI